MCSAVGQVQGDIIKEWHQMPGRALRFSTASAFNTSFSLATLGILWRGMEGMEASKGPIRPRSTTTTGSAGGIPRPQHGAREQDAHKHRSAWCMKVIVIELGQE